MPHAVLPHGLLPEILLAGGERHAARLALQDLHRQSSYAALAAEALRVAGGLRALGVRRGERCAVVLPNSVGFAAAHFGVMLAGAVSMPMDAAVSAESFAFMAGVGRPRVLLTSAAAAPRLAPAAREAGVAFTVCTDAAVDAAAAPAATAGLLGPECLDGGPPGAWLDGIDADSLASLMFTTGTTGRAKGVCLSHANVLHALRNIGRFVGYGAEDREVVILPLSHNFGMGHLYCNLMHGGAVYTEPGLARVGRVLEMVERFGATGFPGTPTGFGLLIDRYGPVLAQRCAGLRFCVINSAPLPPERAAQLQALLPRTELMAYYGLTEASRSSFISLTREGPSRHRSVGRAMDGVRLEIRTAAGARAAPGEAGEIVIQGPTVTAGYWQNPQDSAHALRDGWLHTGDLGTLDGEGFLSVTGRLKDIVNVGGYKVNPLDVERVLALGDGVADAGVVGLDGLDGVTGETLVAALVPTPGRVLTTDDIAALEALCHRRLEPFKWPRRWVVLDAIPRTETGKPLRAALAAAVAQAIAQEAAHA